jgi:heat shock protein HslJ
MEQNRKPMKNTLILLGVFLLTFSCKDAQNTMQTQPLSSLDGTYEVSNLTGVELDRHIPYFVFDKTEGKVTGKTGCNSFFGMYNTAEQLLEFRDIASTEMACEPEVMEVERKFMNVLWSSGKAKLTSNSLTIFDKEDDSILLVATKKAD